MYGDAKLTALVTPVVNALELQLWGIEYITQGRRKTIRVYIDKEGGVMLSDCEEVSRQISSLFDVEDPVSGEYTLEVSSPGLDRPLYEPEHYAQFIGHMVKVKLRQPFEGRRKFKGIVRAVEDNEVSLVVDQHEYILPIESIEKANIVPQFSQDRVSKEAD